jgi:hypothetical protein
MAAGEDAREAQQTLGLLEAYLSILERHSEYLSRKSHRARLGDASGPLCAALVRYWGVITLLCELCPNGKLLKP